MGCLAIALGGGRLTFYKMQAGQGTIANDEAIPPMTALVTPICDIPISSYVIEGDGQITLFGNINSEDLDTGFTFKELGVFATIEQPVAGKGGTPSGPNIQAIVQTPGTLRPQWCRRRPKARRSCIPTATATTLPITFPAAARAPT